MFLTLLFAPKTLAVSTETAKPSAVTYQCTVSLYGDAEISLIALLNNSKNEFVNGRMIFDYWLDLGKPEGTKGTVCLDWRGVGHCYDIMTYDNGTHVYFELNATFEPYEIDYFPLNFTAPNPLEFGSNGEICYNWTWKTDAERPSLIIRLPKYSTHKPPWWWWLGFGGPVDFGLNQCAIKEVCPYPTAVLDEGKYITVIWSEPTTFLEDGSKLFCPYISFTYEYSETPVLHSLPEIYLGFLLGIVGGIVLSLLRKAASRRKEKKGIKDILTRLENLEREIKRVFPEKRLNVLETRIGEIYARIVKDKKDSQG